MAVLAATAVAVGVSASPLIRVPLAVLCVFLLPGYALSIALFPTGSSTLSAGDGGEQTDDITILDRAVVSVGSSLSLVVLVGLLLNAAPIALSTASLLGGLGAATVGAMLVGIYRRRSVSPERAFVPFARARNRIDAPRSGRHYALTLVLALSVLFAAGAVTASVGQSDAGSSVTEFYFVSETPDGGGAAADYPTNFTLGERRTVTVAVGNLEGEETAYAVVGQLQRVERRGDTTEVTDRRRIEVERVTVPAGETRTIDTAVTPQSSDQYRLAYLLFRGNPPERPSEADAYRSIHLWIDVEEPDGGATT